MQYLKYILLIINLLAVSYSSNAQEEIYVFTQAEDQLFISETLPMLKAYTDEKGIELKYNDILMRVPKEITSTPAIIYKNPKGRAIYAGRYTAFSSIENFIRTNRNSPKASKPICKTNDWYHTIGRLKWITSIKITENQGAEAPKQALNTNDLLDFSMYDYTKGDICIDKTDRNFYMDFHPYFDKGKCYLAYELYSQFDCIKPIYSKMYEPIIVNQTEVAKAFAQASAEMAKQISMQLRNSKVGDALTPINADVADKAWEVLSPMDNSAIKITPTDFDPTGKWQFESAIDEDTPIIQFNFKAPLDRYIGEVKAINGHFEVDEQQRIKLGQFTAKAQSLTMGMADFDQKIHEKYIKAFKYPEAIFEFDANVNTAIQIGQTIYIPGQFTLMGKSIPITVAATFNSKNANQMLVNCQFEVNIMDTYKIKGPDGPTEASEVVEFNMNFIVTR